MYLLIFNGQITSHLMPDDWIFKWINYLKCMTAKHPHMLEQATLACYLGCALQCEGELGCSFLSVLFCISHEIFRFTNLWGYGKSPWFKELIVEFLIHSPCINCVSMIFYWNTDSQFAGYLIMIIRKNKHACFLRLQNTRLIFFCVEITANKTGGSIIFRHYLVCDKWLLWFLVISITLKFIELGNK